jgi:hypothetical protein
MERVLEPGFKAAPFDGLPFASADQPAMCRTLLSVLATLEMSGRDCQSDSPRKNAVPSNHAVTFEYPSPL